MLKKTVSFFIFICALVCGTACMAGDAAFIDGLIPENAQGYECVITEASDANPIGYSESIDLTPYAGKGLLVSGEVKADGVTAPSGSYGGIKFMVHVKGGTTFERWPCATDGVFGTFDWTPFSFTVVIPPNVDFAELILGLQKCTGKVAFRNIKASLIETFPPVWSVPEGFKCEYDSRVTGDIRRRGVMSPHTRDITEQDLADMESWGVNLLRWQFQPYDNAVRADLDKYAAFLEDEIVWLEKMLPLCEKHGIKVLIDMHCPPGGTVGKNPVLATAGEKAISKQDAIALYFKMFLEDEYLDAFVSSWRKIAGRLKGNPAVWGYDLCNEPYHNMPVRHNYLECQYLAAQAVRAVDPDVPIVVESNNSANVYDYSYMQPLPLKNIIYQIHYYNPGAYTHQGVFNGTAIGSVYPGTVGGKYFDRARMAEDMAFVKKFEEKYGARIFCGEFSVICWAPGGERYLEDIISVLEENNWDWTFHAFREWDGWSVEHTGTDPEHIYPAAEDTPRKKVLLKYLRKNRL